MLIWQEAVILSFTLFILIFFATQNIQRKKALQNESGEEAFNRNHKAYNARLPDLYIIKINPQL